MIGVIADVVSFFGSVLQYGVAIGALILATLAFGSRYHPSFPWPAQELAVLVFGACIAVSAWSWSGIAHDQREELKQARVELDRWKAAMAEQARQRAEYEAVAAKQRQLAQDRALELRTYQEIVDGYEDQLASDDGVRCAPDDAYSRTMRSIPIHRGRPSEAP